MKRRMAALVCALGLLLAAHALGETRVYTYGGSKVDALYELAVSSDGRIAMTGYTNSSDGTLADRTKTGRSGWVLCIDARGEVLFSFCSRLGTHDTMSYPVFHEDGSLTVILEAEPSGGQTSELIRLDREGNVILRETMLTTGGDVCYIRALRVERSEGYVLGVYDEAIQGTYWLYDWDGQPVRAMEEGDLLVSAAQHVIRVADRRGTLYAVDAQGNETALTDVLELGEDGLLYARYNELISMEDGSAVGCGWVLRGTQNSDRRQGRITRWDAQGQTVFDMWMETGLMDSMVRIPGGFAVSSCPEEDEENPIASELPWKLLFFDEAGVYTGSETLGIGAETGHGCPIAGLPDGSVVALQCFWEKGDNPKENVRVTIVTPE